MSGAAPERAAVERRVYRLAEEYTSSEVGTIHADSLWDDDVFGSMEEIDFILRCEAEFHVSLPIPPVTPEQTAILSRRPPRMRDFVDLVLLQWGTGLPDRACCPLCQYSLAGLHGHRCPECGYELFIGSK